MHSKPGNLRSSLEQDLIRKPAQECSIKSRSLTNHHYSKSADFISHHFSQSRSAINQARDPARTVTLVLHDHPTK
jgi:hypothetical protein